jgi:P4 family phage/plasmid primase-like protien
MQVQPTTPVKEGQNQRKKKKVRVITRTATKEEREKLKQISTVWYNKGLNLLVVSLEQEMDEETGIIDPKKIKRPSGIAHVRDYLDNKNRLTLERIHELIDITPNPALGFFNGKQHNNLFFMSIDIDIDGIPKEEVKETYDAIVEMVTKHIPISLHNETTRGLHIYLLIKGDPDKIFDAVKNTDGHFTINNIPINIEFRFKSNYTTFAGEGYSELKGELEEVELDYIKSAMQAVLDALKFIEIVGDNYEEGSRNNIIYTLSAIQAKAGREEDVAVMTNSCIAIFYNDLAEYQSRITVTRNTYEAYRNNEPLDDGIERYVPEDKADEIRKYYGVRKGKNNSNVGLLLKKVKVKDDDEEEDEEEKKEDKLMEMIAKFLPDLEYNAKALDIKHVQELFDFNLRELSSLYLHFRHSHYHYIHELYDDLYAKLPCMNEIKYDPIDEKFYYYNGIYYQELGDVDKKNALLIELLLKPLKGYISKLLLEWHQTKKELREIKEKKKEGEEERKEGETTTPTTTVEDLEEKFKELSNKIDEIMLRLNAYMQYIHDPSRLKKLFEYLTTKCYYDRSKDPYAKVDEKEEICEYDKMTVFEDCILYVDKTKKIIKLLELSPKYFVKSCLQAKIKDKVNTDINNINIDFVKSTNFWKFFVDLSTGDESLAYTLMVIIASSALVSYTKKKKVYFLVGGYNSGKSTLMNLLKAVMNNNNYYDELPYEALTTKHAETGKMEARPELVKVKDVRIVRVNEPRHGVHYNDSHLKTATGGDNIQARKILSNNIINYRPKYTLFILSNDPPSFTDKSKAMKERIVIIPFNNEFVGSKEDKNILEKLLDGNGKETFFAVIVEMLKVALKEELEDAISRCKAIVDATNEAWYEHDSTQRFLDTCLRDAGDDDDTKYVIKDELYQAYASWCNDLGIKPVAVDTFIRLVKKKIPARRITVDYERKRSLAIVGYHLVVLSSSSNSSSTSNGNTNGNGKTQPLPLQQVQTDGNGNDDDTNHDASTTASIARNASIADNAKDAIDATTTASAVDADDAEGSVEMQPTHTTQKQSKASNHSEPSNPSKTSEPSELSNHSNPRDASEPCGSSDASSDADTGDGDNNNSSNGNCSNGNGNDDGDTSITTVEQLTNDQKSNTNADADTDTNTDTDTDASDGDDDRRTLDKILFALFSEENGGYYRCPVCNDNARYTSPYVYSQHVCYSHSRNYGSFNVDGMIVVKVQDFIRLLQKFYPVTEDHGWTYFIRKMEKDYKKVAGTTVTTVSVGNDSNNNNNNTNSTKTIKTEILDGDGMNGNGMNGNNNNNNKNDTAGIDNNDVSNSNTKGKTCRVYIKKSYVVTVKKIEPCEFLCLHCSKKYANADRMMDHVAEVYKSAYNHDDKFLYTDIEVVEEGKGLLLSDYTNAG